MVRTSADIIKFTSATVVSISTILALFHCIVFISKFVRMRIPAGFLFQQGFRLGLNNHPL